MAARFFGSQSSLREANRDSLVEALYRYGAMTQIELAEITGLSTATVSNLVRQLVEEGKLATQNTIRNGRRATLVTIAHTQGVSIGIAISRHSLLLTVIDSAHNILAEHRLPLPVGHKVDTTMERAMVLINETMETIGISFEQLVGIGIAVAAPVDCRSGLIPIPGILPGWDNIDLVTPLTNAFHVPVVVENDSNCAALCEARMGAGVGISHFVCVTTDGGAGAGIISRDELYHGVTGMAGEIGHIQVDPMGAICACGNRGCLDTVVNEQRLVSLLSVTHGDMTLEDLVQAAIEGDPGCRRVIADTAVRIGTACASLCISVDPQIVVVAGQLAHAEEIFIEPFQETLQRLLFPDVLSPIEVKRAQYPDNNSAIGAGLLAIEQADLLHFTNEIADSTRTEEAEA